jgi:hypothetical protein
MFCTCYQNIGKKKLIYIYFFHVICSSYKHNPFQLYMRKSMLFSLSNQNNTRHVNHHVLTFLYI